MVQLLAVVATLVALAGFLVTLAHLGYLAMLSSAANRRGSSGAPTSDYVRSQRPTAAAFGVVALIGLICTVSGSGFIDLIGLVLGGGAGLAGFRALRTTRREFSSQR